MSHTYAGDGTYSATLQITAPGGCNGTVTNNVIVNANPSPSFTSNSVCLTTGTQFTNTTPAVPAIATWAWDFTNNGSTDNSTQNPTFTYPTAGTFTTALTATTTAGCVGTFTSSVTVNPNPVASFTATTECLNVATAFNSNASSIAAPDNIAFYNWTFGDGQNASGANTSHTYATCGNFTANLTVVSNNNCVNSTTANITVKCLPTVTVPTNTVVCPATAIAATNFTSNPAGATYAWTNTQPSINLVASGTGDVPTFNTTNTGSTQLDGAITVTPTLLGCVGTPSTYTVSVRPTPVMTPIANATYCPSNAVPAASFASTPTGSTFAWTNTQTLIGLAANGATPYAGFSATNTGSTTLVGTISVTPTLNTCVGLPITYDITVNPTPVATVPANATYCSLDAVPATGFNSTPAGATFTWTNTNATIGIGASGSGQIATFNAANTTSLLQTGTIAVTPTLNTCVGLPVSYNINVNPTPIITPIANVLECPAVNVPTNTIISTPAGATFAWTNSNANIGLAATSGTGNITAFTTSNLTAVNEVSTITITPTLNSCIGPNVSYTITVKPTPVLTVPTSLTYCPNVTTVPSPNFTSVPTGATVNWTNNNISIGLSGTGTNDYAAFTPLNTSSTNQVSTIVATPTLNACVGLPQTYSITVFPKPIASVPSNSEACPGYNVTGFVFGSTPNDPNTNYNWIHTNGNIGLNEGTTVAETSTNSSNFVATNINNTFITSTFTLITDLNGCFSDPQSFTFTVNPLPIALFGTSHTCFGESTQFNSNSSVGSGSIVTHQWDYNNDNVYEVNGNNPSPSTIISSIGNQTIHLNVITDKGCATDTVILMYVNPNPVPTISVDDPDGCPDHFANLAGGVQGSSVDHANSIVSWAWDFETNSSSDHTSQYAGGSEVDSVGHLYINTSPTQSLYYQVTLTATTDSGCVGNFTTNPTFITVFANPIADFGYGPSDPLPGVDNPLVQFIDQSQGASSWNWNFGDPYSSTAANISNFQNPQHYYESYDAQSYNVTLIINNGQCWDTIVKPIPILPNWTFYIPNAFSPNEDGINDGFRATGVGIEEFKIYIFDRWGEQIWYSGDLDEYWDGKVQGKNKIVQQDVYVWKVQFKDGKNTKHIKEGTVTVVR
ncbi:MAG: gliding motility-associated C-terminal domain-containing protein [Bacteroidetes bacterium]|nr:gliding motility-associated C-terminal domain-containing protein [Bacteroidota bacterium]